VAKKQLGHLLDEELARVVITPTPIEYIPGDQQKIDLGLDRKIDQVFKGLARCRTQSLDGRRIVTSQTYQGAIEVNIGGVKESEHRTAGD
jgi:hypothetical protein